VLYTISNLIIADAFPASKQSLAGGVFNTVSQIGNSVGLTIGAVISATVTTHEYKPSSIEALEKSFRATFWFCLAAMF
jgi:MFS family permease